MIAMSQLRTEAMGPAGGSGAPDGRLSRTKPVKPPTAVYHVVNVLTAAVVTLSIIYLGSTLFGAAAGMAAQEEEIAVEDLAREQVGPVLVTTGEREGLER